MCSLEICSLRNGMDPSDKFSSPDLAVGEHGQVKLAGLRMQLLKTSLMTERLCIQQEILIMTFYENPENDFALISSNSVPPRPFGFGTHIT